MSAEAVLLPYAIALIGALFGLLVIVIGWVGTQISTRLDTLAVEIRKVSSELGRIEGDLREDMHGLDSRVGVLEATCRLRERRAPAG